MSYPFGSSVRVTATFRDEDDELFDPAVVLFRVKAPSETETTYTYGDDAEVVKDSTGIYHMWVTGNQAGTWAYRAVGDDEQDVANESSFDVDESAFDNP
jgi:hypothetical protein